MREKVTSKPFLSAEGRGNVRKSDTHRHADYAELLCLINPDRVLSNADLEDRLLERTDVGDVADESDLIVGGGNGAADIPDAYLGSQIDSATSRRVQAEVTQIREQLQYRVQAFGATYPFRLTSTGTSFQLTRKKRLREVHKLYLFLLIASDAKRISDGSSHPKVYTAFEQLATEMMKRLLPPGAEVHPFGTATKRGQRFYGGSKISRMEKLAKELRGRSLFTSNNTEPTDSGDGGIDTVGWLPFADSADGILTLIGGATCSYRELTGKLMDTSVSKIKNKLMLRVPHVNVCFVPFLLRKATGKWHLETEIGEAVIVDRLRFVKSLEDNNDLLARIGMKDLMRDCIATKESIV